MKLTVTEYAAKHGCVCPYCGSDQTEGHEIEIDGNQAHQECTCNSCDATWTDIYHFAAIMETNADIHFLTDEVQEENKLRLYAITSQGDHCEGIALVAAQTENDAWVFAGTIPKNPLYPTILYLPHRIESLRREQITELEFVTGEQPGVLYHRESGD